MNEQITPALVAELRNNIVALARRLRQTSRDDSENWSELMVLGAIERGAGMATPSAIGAELEMRSSNLAQLLGALDARGLIQRTPDAHDKRKVRLALTEAGLARVQQTRTRRDRWLSDAMTTCLSASEQAQLHAAGALLRRLASANSDAASSD